MKTSQLVGSVLQRVHPSLPGHNRVSRSASASHGSRPTSELSLRTAGADTLARTRSLPPALPTPSPTVVARPPRRDAAPHTAGPGSHAEVQKATDQVGWLSSLQKDVEDQTARVGQRLNQARQELADKQRAAGLRQQPQSQPADLRQAQEQVDMLSWRHRTLGERQQAVAQMLQEARNDLAQAQGAMTPPHAQDLPAQPLAPTTPRVASPAVSLAGSPLASPVATPSATPFATPSASAASSPAASRPASPQTRSTSAASSTTRQEQSLARLTQHARELEQTARQLKDQLNALKDVAQLTATLRDQADSQHEAAEADIPKALMAKNPGAVARLDTQSAKAYAVMTALQQSEEALDQSQEALTARLDSVRRDLAATRQQLAAAGGSVGETSNTSHRSSALSASTSARSLDGADLLMTALPQGGAALARLAGRAARASPRTVTDWLRATFQGRPKPMEGPRQDAFIQLVQTDVMAVARQGMLHPSDAIDLMRTAVTEGQLGASLSPDDRHELLAALNVVEADQAHLG